MDHNPLHLNHDRISLRPDRGPPFRPEKTRKNSVQLVKTNFRINWELFAYSERNSRNDRSRGVPAYGGRFVFNNSSSIRSNDTSKVATNEKKSSYVIRWRSSDNRDDVLRRINFVESHDVEPINDQRARRGQYRHQHCCCYSGSPLPSLIDRGKAAPKHDAATKM